MLVGLFKKPTLFLRLFYRVAEQLCQPSCEEPGQKQMPEQEGRACTDSAAQDFAPLKPQPWRHTNHAGKDRRCPYHLCPFLKGKQAKGDPKVDLTANSFKDLDTFAQLPIFNIFTLWATQQFTP